MWNAHRVETIESYCKEYNAKYADITKEAGLILVETVNLLIGLQALDIDRYSLEPFLVTRNGFGADPTVAVAQLETSFEVKYTMGFLLIAVIIKTKIFVQFTSFSYSVHCILIKNKLFLRFLYKILLRC